MFLDLPILMVNFVFSAKKSLKMSAIFLRTALVLNIIMNACNPSNGTQISHFISSLDREQKILLLLRVLHLHFDQVTVIMINRFMSSAAGKIHRLKKGMVRELEAP